MRPKSGAHLQFAYFESSLVVEWLLERWGPEKMKQLLADLAVAALAPVVQAEALFDGVAGPGVEHAE